MSNTKKVKEIIYAALMCYEMNVEPCIPADMVVHKNMWEKVDEKMNQLLVPNEGVADTLAGELLRAYRHIQYKWFNDGDSPFSGEPDNVIPDFLFIAQHCKSDESEEIFNKLRLCYEKKDKDMYKRFIMGHGTDLSFYITNSIINTIWSQAFEENNKDSRSACDEKIDICDPDLYKKYCVKNNNGFDRDVYDDMAWWCKSQPDKWDVKVDPDYHTDIKITMKEKGLEWLRNINDELGLN